MLIAKIVWFLQFSSMKNNSLQYEQEFNILHENLRTNPYLIVGSGIVMPKVITIKKLLNLTGVIMKA